MAHEDETQCRPARCQLAAEIVEVECRYLGQFSVCCRVERGEFAFWRSERHVLARRTVDPMAGAVVDDRRRVGYPVDRNSSDPPLQKLGQWQTESSTRPPT